jgi:hypothetical protein
MANPDAWAAADAVVACFDAWGLCTAACNQ